MSLKDLLNQGKLKPHKTNKEEIKMLLQLINRDIQDALIETLSEDRRFAIAYNVILQSATVILYCKGYKTTGTGHHYTTFLSLKFILGKNYYALINYFNDCRAKRNLTDYISAGQISEKEANEIVDEAKKFHEFLISWLKKNYPNYL